MSHRNRVRPLSARRFLRLESLERRDNPSFNIELPSSGIPIFMGGDGDDQVIIGIDADGLLTHDLVQPDLESPLDMDSFNPGIQAVLALPGYLARVEVYGNGGNDRLVVVAPVDVVANGGDGNDDVVTGVGNDTITIGQGNDNIYTGDGTDTLFAYSVGPVVVTPYTFGGDYYFVNLLGTSSLTGQAERLEFSYAYAGIDAAAFPGSLDVGQAFATDAVFRLPAGGSHLNLTGSRDSVVGGAGADVVSVVGFDGSFDLAGGNDTLYAYASSNAFTGGPGADFVSLYATTATITDTAATINGVTHPDHQMERFDLQGVGAAVLDASGFSGYVSFSGGDSPSRLVAGSGGSDLDAGPTPGNTLTGGAGDDQIFPYQGAADTFSAGPGGQDSLYLFSIQNARGTDATLTLDGHTQPNGFEYIQVAGTSGNDVLDFTGWSGRVVLYGGYGDDVLRAGNGALPTENGLAFNDLYGGIGNDLLVGGSNRDTLYGDFGSDTLLGGAGDDILVADSGYSEPPYTENDSLAGGNGDDYLSVGLGSDTVTGGAGTDTLEAINVGQLRLTNTSLRLNAVTVANPSIERLIAYGTEGTDLIDASGFTRGPVTIVGGSGADSVRGGEGDDVLIDYGGQAQLFGNGGNDVLNGGRAGLGGAGDDYVTSGTDGAVLTGDGGNDIVYASGAGCSLTGGAGNDQVSATGPGATVSGGAGNDILQTGGGGQASGGTGDDTVYATGTDVATGDGGTDWFQLITTGHTLTLTNAQLTVDGQVRWANHGFESGQLFFTNADDYLLGVSVDAVGFTRAGPLDLTTGGGPDTVRVAARAAGTVDLGDQDGTDGDTLIVVGTAGRDTFNVTETPASEIGRGFLSIGVNADALSAFGVGTLRLEGLGGVNTLSLPAPLSMPLYASGFAPVVSAGGNVTINTGSFSRGGSFTDPGLGQTWTATVSYGDGTGTQPLTLNPDGTFTLTHTYTRRSIFTVRVTVTDNEGNATTVTFQVTVTGL